MKKLLLILAAFGPRFAFAQGTVVLPLCTAFQNSNCTIPATAITGPSAFDASGNLTMGAGALLTDATGQTLQNGAPGNNGAFPNTPHLWRCNINGYCQVIMQNLSSGANASGVYIITGDLGGNTSWYFEFGQNSSKYSNSSFPVEVSSASFMASSDGPLIVQAGVLGGQNGAAASFQYILFVTSTSLSQMQITQSSVTVFSPSGLLVNYGLAASTASFGVAPKSTFTSLGALNLAMGTGGLGGYAGGQFYSNFIASTTNASTNEITLSSFTLPANTLNANGQGVRIRFWGFSANNADTKTIKIYFGANAETTTTLATSVGNSWAFDFYAYRTSATGIVYYLQSVDGSTTKVSNSNDSPTLSNANVLKVTGTNGTGTNADITLSGITMEFIGQYP